MTSVVQDVGSERGVGGGGHDGPGGGHGHHRRSGGGRDPQLLEVDGGEALALSLHLLQHPGGPPGGRGQRVEQAKQGRVILHDVM